MTFVTALQRLLGPQTQGALSLHRDQSQQGPRISAVAGEPGGRVAHVPSATSLKTRAAGRPGPAALTPSQTNPATEVLTVNHGTRADAERLKAEITSQQRLLDGLDRAIGSLYESRQVGVSRLFDLQAQLASITDRHYAQMVIEAQALAREAS